MTVRRFLGSEWVAVHAPTDPSRLLVWILEAGFEGMLAAPGPRPLDWARLRAAASDLPASFAAVRVGSVLSPEPATTGLASGRQGEQEQAMRAVQDAVAVARTLGCPRIVLEPGLVPVLGEIEEEDLGESSYRWDRERADAMLARRKVGRDAALDRACRSLHAIVRSFPDIGFSLAVGRNIRALADRQALADLYEDLHQLPLGYWHDAAAAARREQVLGDPQGELLEAFGNRLQGMSLGDASADGMYLPPGSGGVDYGLLATYIPRTGPCPAVLELDPSVGTGELQGMHSCLDRFGL